jgi:ribosomal protein S27AE
LAKLDSWFFTPGGLYPLAPSVFVQAEATGNGSQSMAASSRTSKNRADLADPTQLFCCPACGGEGTFVLEHETKLQCQQCSKPYMKRDGIWDFKEASE